MRFICLIPARKNSKRLKNKNFINLKGKPLVEWTLNLSNKICYLLLIDTNLPFKISNYPTKSLASDNEYFQSSDNTLFER